MTASELAASAYELWGKRDVDGAARLFSDGAVFVIPGETRVSGVHQGEAIKEVFAVLAAAAAGGLNRQELVCKYESEGGVMFVFDNFVKVDGRDEKYHSAHEWIMRDDRLVALMIYVHEYDLFARVWA